MKKTILILLLTLTFMFSFGQTKNSIIMNDSLIAEYFKEYVTQASQLGYDVQDQLLGKISYILIAPDSMVIEDLSKTDLNKRFILLDSKVRLDRLILKGNLYRELSYTLGIPYNIGSVIMDRKKEKHFSYVAFDDYDSMSIELGKVLVLN